MSHSRVLTSGDFVTVLDGILEGFQILDRDLRYLHVNDAAAKHGRTTREALLGRTMAECYPGIEGTGLYAMLRQTIADGKSHSLENAFTFPDGSTGHFELRIEPVPQGVCVLSIDITARKNAEAARAKAEERLQTAQRMEAVGQLAAGIAHDFNNLLTIILGQADVALSRPEGPTRADVETLLAAARSSSELTRQLLTYGQRTSVAREQVDLGEVVTGLERMLRRSLGQRIDLRIEAREPPPKLSAIRSQIEQILLNLVFNARDAIAGEGRVTITLARTELDEADIGGHPGARPGPHALIGVADSGEGMDAATRARIFEPFFTTKEKGRGTGLGLATVYGIVRQHGGVIWVYSEPGKGTSFKVYLPIAEAETSADATAPAPPSPRRGSVASAAKGSASPAPARPTAGGAPSSRGGAEPTILVVDDAPLLRKLIAAVLEGAGYEVLAAARGEDALALWEAHEDQIALLITDLVMPGMGGADLIDRLRGQKPELPIICTSGYSSAELMERRALPAGVAFVEKPFRGQVLLGKVAALLRREPEGSALPVRESAG